MVEEHRTVGFGTSVAQSEKCEDCKDLAVLECIAANDRWSLFVDDILASLVDRMVNIGKASSGVIYLYENAGNRLLPKGRSGARKKELTSLQPDLREGFLGTVIRSKESQLLYEPRKDVQLSQYYPEDSRVTVVAGVPIRVRGVVTGLALIDFEDVSVFSLADVRRLELLTDHAAVAIENALLYEDSRRREDELGKANEELKEVDRMKSEFLSLVSHELRTPLTSVIGYVDLVLRGVEGELSEKQRKYLTSARFSSRELLCLINNLIDYSCLETGQVQMSPWPIIVEPLMKRLEHFARITSEGKGIGVNLEVEPAIPPLQADETRLQHALESLLSNAVKFSSEGGRIILCASYSDDTREVEIRVTDFGIGIPTDKLERIWDRFYQIDSSSTRQYGGLGLGLATAKKQVELMGGRIWAESEGSHKGATFVIAMPTSKELAQ